VTYLRPPARGWVRFLRFWIWAAFTVASAVVVGRWIAENNLTSPGQSSAAAGSGSVDNGGPSPITIKQTAALTDLHPGGAPQVLSGTFVNAGASPVYIGSVEAKLATVTGGLSSCTLASYELLNPVMPVGRSVPVGENGAHWSGATVRMIDAPGVQDGCQRATVNITYTAR
jgi:hypothetical protein